ncbi:MAG: hypothetical protein ACT4N5_00950 [Nitrosopumilaceae archaeon]
MKIVFLMIITGTIFILFDGSSFASASHATVDFIATDLSWTYPVEIRLFDPALTGAGTVSVTVTTTSDPVGITLLLNEVFPGFFDNLEPTTLVPQLYLMNGDNKFPLETTLEATYVNENFYDPNVIDVLTLFVDTRDGEFIEPVITETGPNTGVFKGIFTLSATGPSNENIFQITSGEIFNIFPPCGNIVNGQITPIQDGSSFGAIKAEFGDTVTVTYGDSSHTDTAVLSVGESGCGGGGSGGGLVINRIVLDVLAGGASGGDFIAPQLTIPKLNLSSLPLVGDILNFITNADPFTPIAPLDDSSIDYPLSINGNGYLLTQYANTIQTYTGKTGEPISFKMILFDSTGVEHIGFYTNLREDKREISNSDTFVIYHEDKPLGITDPNGYFANVNFTESEYDGKYVAEFNLTFAKPMDTSDVIIRTWDELRNSGDIKIFDALKIDGEPLVNPDASNLIVPDSADIIIPYYKLPYYEIPDADSEGNLIYYNSFGGLEENQVHPKSFPIVYPQYVGKSERHDNGFDKSIINEDTKAQTVSQSLIGNPFSSTEDNKKEFKFYYPSNVGKLDRENKDSLKDLSYKENMKALQISAKKYRTNQVLD